MNCNHHREKNLPAPESLRSISFLQQLSSDVVVGNILPYILQKKTLATIASISKHFRDTLLSHDAEHIWNHDKSSFHLCIDTYCASCMMKKLQRKGSHFGSIGFLKKFPIGNLKLHCFVTDIPDCIVALSTRRYLRTLDLTLSNKTNSPPLEALLGALKSSKEEHLSFSTDFSGFVKTSDIGPKSFPDLKDLVLDSSHLQHVNLPGRALLLDILGTNLETLTFSGLSPAGVFSILTTRCPMLKKLRVDRASSLADMQLHHSTILEELELCRSNFLLQEKCFDGYPALRSLKYTPSFRCDSAQMEAVIAASPAILKNLCLEIPSLTVSDVLNAISRRLFLIENLSLQGSYEPGMLTQAALLKISRKCLCLKTLEIRSSKSVSDINMDVQSFMTFGMFPSLRSLRVKFDDALMSSASEMLRLSDSLETLTFWERKKWIPVAKWDQMQCQINEINKQFPNRHINLESVIC